MSYQSLLESLEIKEMTIEEEVEQWTKLSAKEKADLIKETKDSGDKDKIKHLLEVADMAKSNTEAGGTGTQTGDEILAKKGGTGDDTWSDTDANLSDKGKMAAAAGIGAGLGALGIAKKLRRAKAADEAKGE
jgi:hypothetical protein